MFKETLLIRSLVLPINWLTVGKYQFLTIGIYYQLSSNNSSPHPSILPSSPSFPPYYQSPVPSFYSLATFHSFSILCPSILLSLLIQDFFLDRSFHAVKLTFCFLNSPPLFRTFPHTGQSSLEPL